MGVFDKLKDFMGLEETEDDDEEVEEARPSAIVPQTPPTEFKPLPKVSVPAPVKTETTRPEEKRQTFSGAKYTNQFKLVVIEPAGFDESPKLVDSLKAKKPVIINLENLETDVARKIFDFLSGATYALNGNVQKVANNIFIFAPENVDVSYNVNQKASVQAANAPKSPWNK